MNVYNFNPEQLILIKNVCELGIIQYSDDEFKTEGIKIIDEISKQRFDLLITNKQKRIIASFLANWYKENEKNLVDLQSKMMEVNYDSKLLLHLQSQVKKLNIFIDLLKIFNKSFYQDLFEGTEKNYIKRLSEAIIK